MMDYKIDTSSKEIESLKSLAESPKWGLSKERLGPIPSTSSEVEDILFFLRADLVRNLGNMCNPELHKGRFHTPHVIQEYINEVRYQLRIVCDTDSKEFSVDKKIAFIHETRHAFGRTALLLSGGAALGAFHLGVVRTLIEHRLLPRVVAGASVGSITCAFTATRTWSELQSFFDDPMPPMHFFESMGSIIATAHSQKLLVE